MRIASTIVDRIHLKIPFVPPLKQHGHSGYARWPLGLCPRQPHSFLLRRD
jgi:hypothetical protein